MDHLKCKILEHIVDDSLSDLLFGDGFLPTMTKTQSMK
jgi:hypothetical protein